MQNSFAVMITQRIYKVKFMKKISDDAELSISEINVLKKNGEDEKLQRYGALQTQGDAVKKDTRNIEDGKFKKQDTRWCERLNNRFVNKGDEEATWCSEQPKTNSISLRLLNGAKELERLY